MENLLSTKGEFKVVPESYILPPEDRPGNTKVPLCDTIPVIDFKGKQAKLVHQIIHASKEFGFFQLVNHGIEEKLLQDVLEVSKEFFELPVEDKASFISDDPMKSCKIFTSIDYPREDVHYWRDVLRHPCHPLEEHIQFWPQKPAKYRDVVGAFTAEVRKLSVCLLDLISKGLGLEPGYFQDKAELLEAQLMAINHYPPCPDPSLTLGLPKHADANLISFILQEMDGLQVLKDEQWLALKPVPNAFVVNIGHILHIISNGKLKSAEHRVVTNKNLLRTTISIFIYPSHSCQVEPATVLTNDDNPPLYRAFIVKDFLGTFMVDTYQRKPPLDRYMLQS
ncbi:hyoscyamine 6-dioxygenase-like [Humulus lupulus]|uniref:hyoscyamine 6-dioxygenase-like n=1 Tax=Humulus lupulus TaxID=3486 RepID=UPI002B402324|nr:hyoscyamine 6-dioxygenase-like [Humulus lupulus]